MRNVPEELKDYSSSQLCVSVLALIRLALYLPTSFILIRLTTPLVSVCPKTRPFQVLGLLVTVLARPLVAGSRQCRSLGSA